MELPFAKTHDKGWARLDGRAINANGPVAVCAGSALPEIEVDSVIGVSVSVSVASAERYI